MSSIFVGNISWKCNEQTLGNAFAEHGQVLSVKIITDRETGRSKGFGYVEMSNEEEQQIAIERMNGAVVEGRAIRTDKAQPRR